MTGSSKTHYDFVIIGSGFGGSVSAMRLTEKGYSVLVIEKGARFQKEDFAKTNWNLRRWMWLPQLGLRGIFKMTFFKHVTVLSGVGVGGGSLTYANTLPVPSDGFFNSESWAHLADWKEELAPHYKTAQHMLGAVTTPCVTPGDRLMKEIAEEMGRGDDFHPNEVAVFFGKPGETVSDPYFDGKGPDRVGCTFCGACMTGCRVGAKNTLDRNYLHLAEEGGARVVAETLVTAVRPNEGGGYRIETKPSFGRAKGPGLFTADNVVFSGGVMGTIDLLLKLKEDPTCLPSLSDRLGWDIRTNNESLIGVVTPSNDIDWTEGIAITSILHTDEHSHVEPVRYGRGSGFFRMMLAAHAPGTSLPLRIFNMFRNVARHPLTWLRVAFVRDFSKHSMVLLYMRTLEGTLRFVRKRSAMRLFKKGMSSELVDGKKPTAYIPEATEIAEKFARKMGGVTCTLPTETLFDTPTTAHILGGACMGATAAEGVIDHQHRVHGYDGLYVIDGSAVSANPGVNPSLTITAMAERAMTFLAAKLDRKPSSEASEEEEPRVLH